MVNRQNRKIIIFAQSYGEIENCLYLSKKNLQYNNSVTIVIPGFYDLFKLIRKINEKVFHNTIEIIYFDLFKSEPTKVKNNTLSRGSQAIVSTIKKRRYNRNLYNKYLAEIKGSEIYFFTRFYVPYNLYFLKKLSKNNKLIYMYISRKRTFQELDEGYGEGLSKIKIDNIRDLLHLIKLKIEYGFDSTMIRIIIHKVPYIPDKFMKQKVYKIISEEESKKLLGSFDYRQFNVFDVTKYSIIYFDQRYFYRDNFVDTEIFQKEIDAIFNILSKYFTNDEIAIKYHPGDYTDKNKIKIGTILDSFIPAEFLYSDNVKMYLSFSSGSLGNVEKGLAVSLVDIITYKTEEIRKKVKAAILNKSHTDIIFPKSLSEFENIVFNIQEHTKSLY